MKKTTSENLSNRLTHYSALSLAIAGIAGAHGQIVYTDVNPDGHSSMSNVAIPIDLDQDMTREFDVRLRGAVDLVIFVNSSLTGASVLGNPEGGSLGNYRYPFALDYGAVIGPIASTTSSAWNNDITQTLVWNNCSLYGGDYAQWCDADDKYLGLRFQIAGQTHYGWARLSVHVGTGQLPEDWFLKDYAYNSVAGETIMAGEGGVLGIDDNTFTEVGIKAFNKSVWLSNLPNQTDYQIFNISGQRVLDGKISSSKYTIEANTLSDGIYVIELMDAQSKAVIRKKIVI